MQTSSGIHHAKQNHTKHDKTIQNLVTKRVLAQVCPSKCWRQAPAQVPTVVAQALRKVFVQELTISHNFHAVVVYI